MMKNILLFIVFLIFISCRTKTEKIEKETFLPEVTAKEHKYIIENGVVYYYPDEIYTISAPQGGFINSICCYCGAYVKKGQVLATLQNYEFINLQEKYLKLYYQLEYYRENLKRQGELTIEEAVSIKKMQQSKAEYWSLQMQANSVSEQLKLMGIQPEYILKKGVVKQIILRSPVDGYISEVNGNIGKYVDVSFPIFSIYASASPKFQVWFDEKYMGILEEDLPVKIIFNNDTIQELQGKISNISTIIIDQKIECICQLENDTSFLNPGLTVKIKIPLPQNL